MIFEKLWKQFYFKAFGKKAIGSRSQTGIIFGKKDSLTRLMVFGDSNAYRPENGRDCWPAMLQRLSGKTLRVINESYDGRTTRYDTGPCNGLNVLEKKIRRAGPLDWVIIALGTNDVKSKYGPPDAVEVVEGIEKIIATVKTVDAHVIPILLSPPPLGHVTTGDLAGAQDRIPPLAVEYFRCAVTQNIPIIDLSLTVDTDVDLESDCVHLNAQGRKKVAEIVWKNLQEISPHVEMV